MTALPPPLAARCAKIVGQLSSPNEGTVFAASRALVNVLQGAGLNICDLAEHITAQPRETIKHIGRPRPAEPSPYPFGSWRRAAGETSSTSTHRARVDHIQSIGSTVMTAWEAEFLESLHDQLVRGRRLSERQIAILDKIEVKIRRRP